MTKAPADDPYRKAKFRERAREIVFKDRQDRRRGFTVDTAGSIARALERAFKERFAAGQLGDAPSSSAVHQDGPVEWALIPPRPRTVFWTICLFDLGPAMEHDNGLELVATTTSRGTLGWLIVKGERHEEVVGDRSVAPLIRLGLLTHAEDDPVRLILSTRGKATWRRFVERGGHYPEDLTSPNEIGHG